MFDKILIIGSSGQIGTELTEELRLIYGEKNVYPSDIKTPANMYNDTNFTILDVMNIDKLAKFVSSKRINQIYLLAAVLSGNAEKNPLKGWDVNITSLLNVLNCAKENNVKKIFWPSSIAVFGKTTKKDNTPQVTVTEPDTIYGISKLAGERWCEYYYHKYRLDIRSIRYPGLISYRALPGGGTTDYAVEIFYEAIKHKKYECFLKKDTVLPMMFMPDAINAALRLMENEASLLTVRSSYNLHAMSFSPEELAAEIKKYIPSFTVTYKPDFRQHIAETWPRTINDAPAKNDWGWKKTYGLSKMTEIMIRELRKKFGVREH